MPRVTAVVLALLGLMGCTYAGDLDKPPVPLGDFHLGHNVVVAPNLAKGPLSREATKAEWIEAVTAAIGERFGRYEGQRLYHLGISVDGYVLAKPGLPLVAAPKSVLVLMVTVWDDAKARKLNPKAQRFTVIEALTPDSAVGSGYTQTREEQIENLSRTAAKQIETWLVRQKREKGWFESAPEPASAPAPAADPVPEPTPGPVPEPAPEAAPAAAAAKPVDADAATG